MRLKLKTSLVLTMAAALAATGCATPPMGPTVTVLPAPNKPFQLFQQDQTDCKAYAQSQLAGQAEAANNRAVGAALLGTALGAGLGAAVGGGRGAGVGAAGGAAIGTGVGSDGANAAQLGMQQQYDSAFVQCMYAKGNQVPGAAAATASVPPPPGPLSSVPPPNAPPPRP